MLVFFGSIFKHTYTVPASWYYYIIRHTKDNQHKLLIVTASLNFLYFYLSTINVQPSVAHFNTFPFLNVLDCKA